MARSLKSQVQALSVLPILGLAAVAIGVSGYLTHLHVDEEAYRKLQEVSHLLQSKIKGDQESLTAQSQLIAEKLSVKAFSARHKYHDIRQVLVPFVKRNPHNTLLIANDTGHVTESVGSIPAYKSSQDLEALISSALHGAAKAKIIFLNGRLYAAASAPIFNAKAVSGVIVNAKPIGDGTARELRDSTSADVALLVKGHVVGSTTSTPLGKHEPGGIWQTTINRANFVALEQPVPDADPMIGATVVAYRSYDELARPFRSFGTDFVPVLIVSLALAALIARLFAASLSKPLDNLVVHAQKVRDGEWPEPLTAKRDDEIGFLISVFNDMTATLRANQERMMSIVDTDPLTELDNHRRFKERMDQEVFRSCMAHNSLVLAIIDFDNFNDFNSKNGHAAGDEALKKMSRLLSQVSPDVAFLARYGGEEFAVLLPLASLEDGEALLTRLQELVQSEFGNVLTFSAGLADMTSGVSNGSGLALSAEMALSQAKHMGRNRICRFDSVPGAAHDDDPFQLQKYLKDSTLATIQALAGAVDAKDPYTQGHSMRVAKFAADLARYMGNPKEFIELVYKTATLHDVGKIGVPDSVLSKPSRLDAEEKAIMESHSVLGELIVKKAPQLHDVLPGVRHHHERWDGKGYPDKLMGKDIPLLARYISIADTFDAMTSDRPYRKALPDDVALEEIRRKAGEQFDPELAESFVRMMRLHGQRAA